MSGDENKNTIVNNRGLSKMKLTTLMTALAVTLAYAHAAQAGQHRYRHSIETDALWAGSHGAPSGASWGASSEPGMSGATPGGRPRAWCGWQMRQLVGGDPGPQFNLARNWTRWGHPGPAGIGAIVVWPHHVGKIVGQEGGSWLIESGNDGNRVRIRPLPITGAIAIRWS
jgi:hypothetical protein